MRLRVRGVLSRNAAARPSSRSRESVVRENVIGPLGFENPTVGDRTFNGASTRP